MKIEDRVREMLELAAPSEWVHTGVTKPVYSERTFVELETLLRGQGYETRRERRARDGVRLRGLWVRNKPEGTPSERTYRFRLSDRKTGAAVEFESRPNAGEIIQRARTEGFDLESETALIDLQRYRPGSAADWQWHHAGLIHRHGTTGEVVLS